MFNPSYIILFNNAGDGKLASMPLNTWFFQMWWLIFFYHAVQINLNTLSSSHLRLHHRHQLLIGLRILLSQCLKLLVHCLLVESTHASSHSSHSTHASHSSVVLVWITFILASKSTHPSHFVTCNATLQFSHQRHENFLKMDEFSAKLSLIFL